MDRAEESRPASPCAARSLIGPSRRESPTRAAAAGAAELPPARRIRVPTARSRATHRPQLAAAKPRHLLSRSQPEPCSHSSRPPPTSGLRSVTPASMRAPTRPHHWSSGGRSPSPWSLRIWPRQGLPRATALGGLLLAAFSLLALLSTIWASDGGRAFAEAARAVGYLGVFVLGAIVVRSGGGRDLLGGLAIGLVGLAALALLSRFQPGLVGSEAELQAALPESAGRLSYPIDYWNGLAAAMALAICLLAWLGADARGRLARSLAIAALPLACGGDLSDRLARRHGGRGCRPRGPGRAGAAALAYARCDPARLSRRRRARTARLRRDGPGPGTGYRRGASRRGSHDYRRDRRSPVLGLIAWRADGFLERFEPRRIGVPAPLAAAVIVIAVLVANAAIEPGEQLQESRSNPEAVAGIETLNGEGVPVSTASGRIEYWESAVDAFQSEPVDRPRRRRVRDLVETERRSLSARSQRPFAVLREPSPSSASSAPH